MNRLCAVVTDVVGEQNLHIIHFDFQGSSLSMMGLDLPLGLHVGSSVVLGAKPSHLAIGKNIQGELSTQTNWMQLLLALKMENYSVALSYM